MAHFKYTAQSRDGEKVSGVIEAFNEVDASRRVKEDYGMVLKISPVRIMKPTSGVLVAEIGANRLKPKAFTVMCSQFATILSAGIPISQTVPLIAERTTDKPLKKLLVAVGSDVENGRSLSASLAEHGGKFLPLTFIETIRAGEESGNVERAFESMYEHFDKQSKMGAKVRGAMAYPLFVMLVAVVVVVVLMWKVVPTFLEMFREFDAQLPLVTRALIVVSDFFRYNGVTLGLVLFILIVGLRIYGGTATGRVNLGKVQLKLPLLGNIATLNAASQFANSMTTLIEAGLPMTRAVNVTSRVMDNAYLSSEVGKLSGDLEEGRSLGASMRAQDVMPHILVDMTAIGEESGELAKTLHTVARFYDEELDQAILSALAKMEPALLVILGGVAAFIVLAVYLAMFTIYAAM